MLDAADHLWSSILAAALVGLAVPFLLLSTTAILAFPASRKAKLLFLLAVANEIRGLVTVGLITLPFLHR